MVTLSERTSPVIQNMGLVDRIARFLTGGGIIGYVVLYHEMKHPSLSLVWQTALVAGALYPLMTAMIGWDPLYAVLNLRSCSPTGRHQCGTLPYQLKAITGRAPKFCDDCDAHSLESCHDSPEERPHHAMWVVDKEPMIYPTDAQLNAYFVAQALKQQGKVAPRRGGIKRAA